MVRILGSGWIGTACVVALWRGASELLARMRELAASGELARRIEARRHQRVERALVRVGVEVASTGASPLARRASIDASVHVGGVGAHDPDDVGLLEAGMRRAARERMGVEADGIRRRPPERTDWVGVLAELGRDDEDAAQLLRQAAPTLLAATGVALTLVPLVRPLAAAAPWLALAGLLLVAAGWFAARRR